MWAKVKKCTGYLKARFACSSARQTLWIIQNEERKRENLNDLLITDWFELAKDKTLTKTKNWFKTNQPHLMKPQLRKISYKICQRSR